MSRWPFLRSFSPGQVGSDPDEEIHEEIELYLELRAKELEDDEGMTPEEARRQAEERFGDTEEIERTLRRQARRRRAKRETTMTMSGLKHDLRYAFRTLRRSPGFTVVALATLALALGGNTAIFSVVDAAVLQALPFDDHEELVFLNGYHLDNGDIAIRGASFPEFRDWKEQAGTITGMSAVAGASLALTGEGTAERLRTEIVTEDYFDVLRVEAHRGRTFVQDEHAQPDAAPVAVISYEMWERRYGLDPSAVGQELLVNDRPLTIVGIMPRGFQGTNLGLGTDLWIPDMMMSLSYGSEVLDARGSRFLTVFGRLARGATPETVQEELDVIARGLQESYPSVHEDRWAQVESFRQGYLGDTGGLLWILLGAGGVLLAIAAANVANLLLVRSHGRTREFVLRRALGAESGRVAGQLLTESLVLAALGGVGGIGVAVWALQVVGPMLPDGALPGYVQPELSSTAFLLSIGVLGLVGVVIGLVPAASSARLDIATRLREGAQASASASLRRLRPQHLFVVAQVALALVLMVGAGLLTRSFRAQVAVDTGARLEGVQAMALQLPASRYDSNETIWNFVRELQRRLEALPGAESVSISSDLPFRGGSSGAYIFREGDGSDDRIRFHRHHVTPSYFETLDVELVDGRLLEESDVDQSPGVIVITDAMARRVYPGESAVGKIMSLRPNDGMPAEIVGVVEDVRYRDITTSLMEDANSPDVFFSFWQIPSRGLEVAVQARGEPQELAPAMRSVVAELDPDLPVFQLEPLIEGWRTQTATPQFAALLMSLFSGLAALLACVGIYGVLAFAVGQRSHEIAIRRAIGASGPRLVCSVVGDGLRLAAAGLLVGVVGALTGARVLERFLYGVGTADPATFVTVVAGMMAVAVVAALVPALRALGPHPAKALKAE
ncbi:MAG: ABC transporter permease [Longimicrobiales bacterium]|nr:ABC transporter permease [Longimicrobiales bacterium]